MAKEIDIKKIIQDVQKQADKRFDGYMDMQEDNFKAIHEHFQNISQKLDNHSVNIEEIKLDINDLRDQMSEAQSDLKQLKYDISMDLSRKVEKREVIRLEGRIRTLERKK